MNDLLSNLSNFSNILEAIFVVFSGLVAYIMNNLSGRISSLEIHNEKLVQEKLDKADYHRDQAKTDGILKEMRDDIRTVSEGIRDLPKVIIDLMRNK